MAPFIALIAVTLVLHTLGTLGVERLRPWVVPVRGGLATMFLMTGGAHFIGMREELIRMVPPLLPAPGFLVTLTGVLELVGGSALGEASVRGGDQQVDRVAVDRHGVSFRSCESDSFSVSGSRWWINALGGMREAPGWSLLKTVRFTTGHDHSKGVLDSRVPSSNPTARWRRVPA